MEFSSKVEKIQAMKNYKKRAYFLYNFILYSLTSLITCLFFSYPFWLPYMKSFLASLPNDISFVFNAKCLFIVGNLIVFILIGESKLTRSSTNYQTSDIYYDEYVARSRSNDRKVNFNKEEKSTKTLNIEDRKVNFNKEKRDEKSTKTLNIEEKKHVNEEKKREMRVSKSMHNFHHEEKKKGLRTSKSEVWGQRDQNNNTKVEKQEIYVPREELNKRVEDFIARVNKQRLLEAKLFDQSKG